MDDQDDGSLLWSIDDLVVALAAAWFIAEGRVPRPTKGELGGVALWDWVKSRVPAEEFGRAQLAIEAMTPAERGTILSRAYPESAVRGTGPVN